MTNLSLKDQVSIWLPKFLSRRAKEALSTSSFVSLVPLLVDESAQGPSYLCDACLRRHTSLPAFLRDTMRARIRLRALTFSEYHLSTTQRPLVSAILYFFHDTNQQRAGQESEGLINSLTS